jgi:putative hydrolase of the HAD superfamily
MNIEVIFFDIGDTLIAKQQWLPGAKEILATLRGKNIRIGLISNTGDWTREQLQERLPDDFDFANFEEGLVLLSSEVGIEKPKISMFSLAVHHAGVSPWATIFVGENLNETLAAQTAGMFAARIDGSQGDLERLLRWISG